MIAGVVMNVLLAIFIYIGICYTWGDNYFSNEDARWGYTFNEAGRKLGFQDGDRIVSIDGEAVDNVNKIVNALIITEGERRVVVEREGRQVELTLPLGELIEMRQNKGYEDLLALRMPFLIDSAVYETASALRRGDEIVAINDAQGLEYPAYREYLKAHAGEDVTLTVKREGDMLLELVVPVSDEGRLGRDGAQSLQAPDAEIHLLAGNSGRNQQGGQGDVVLLGTAEDDRTAQDQDVQGAGRLHRHRQHLPRRLELGGFLDEDGVSVNHPRRDEHSADTGTRRRARHLHVLGDDYGPQGERQDTGGRAVRGAVYHPASAVVRQRQRHIPVFHKIR